MSKSIPSQSVKRTGSANTRESGSGAKKRSRKTVEIPENAWLEALKFLSCLKWSKLRLVSPQLNGLIERNVSRLPLAIIDSVEMMMGQREQSEIEMIVWDTSISQEEKDQWFKDRGITVGVPADIQLNEAIIGVMLEEYWAVDLYVVGFGKELFIAEFSPDRNRFSWASMAYFLKLIYDQSTFVKDLSMYPLDKKLKGILFPDDKVRYIHCGHLAFKMVKDPGPEDLRESLSCLEQNVQAVKIDIATFKDYDDKEVCDAMSNYLLDSSWINASQEVNLDHVNHLEDFFHALIKKFRTLATVQSTFPIILFSGSRFVGAVDDLELKRLLFGNEKLEDSENNDEAKHPEDEKPKDDSNEEYKLVVTGSDGSCKKYTFSNRVNQMEVEFVIIPATTPPKGYATKSSGRGTRPSQFNVRVTVTSK